MNFRKILIQDLICDTYIGFLDHEIKRKQKIKIDAETVIKKSSTKICSDDISCTIDYRKIREIILSSCNNKHYNLLEALALEIAKSLFHSLIDIEIITVRISKIEAFNDCTISVEEQFCRSQL